MKKQFILAGLLAVGFASAQTDKAHLGKVGINILTPQATMDIRPNDDNRQETATTNEGVLIPKLSKTRVSNIENTLLVEGTLVYVTDDASSTIASYAGNNAKVAKITEKGYYFYNGTEWVPAQLNQMGATEGQFLRWNGTAWVPYSAEKKAYTYVGGPREDWMKVVCLGPENRGLTVLFDEGTKAVCEYYEDSYTWLIFGIIANLTTANEIDGTFKNTDTYPENFYRGYLSGNCSNSEYNANELLPKAVFSMMEGSTNLHEVYESFYNANIEYKPLERIELANTNITNYNYIWTKLTGCTALYAPGFRPVIIFPPQMVK